LRWILPGGADHRLIRGLALPRAERTARPSSWLSSAAATLAACPCSIGLELASYVATLIGLPGAIAVVMLEQRKERRNEEEEEIHQRLSDDDMDFLRLVIDHADLQLLRHHRRELPLTDEQQERRDVLFGILVSLFERAYLLAYDDEMSRQTQRLWKSWKDYMREWRRREDFRAALPELLRGETVIPAAMIGATRLATCTLPSLQASLEAMPLSRPGQSAVAARARRTARS
jgi:hypothetical protein